MTNLILDQFFEQTMTSNCEKETWKKHAQRNDDSTRKSIPQSTTHKPSLKPHKRCKNDQWRRQHIANRDAINEYALA
jgi:hypothetical protein